MSFFVGTAGWTVPKEHSGLFASVAQGAKCPHLERYASQFRCVEINSSFHRPHRYSTWKRWAAITPPEFRFAVKAPKAITHTAKLVKAGGALLEFFNAIEGLGEKLGPVLIQLPPKLAFDEAVAEEFFTTVRELSAGSVVVEPRHPTWFAAPVNRFLRGFEIARVAADPPKGSEMAARPGGWTGVSYWRLHGVPRTYYSNYEEESLEALAATLRPLESPSSAGDNWVIFDNTALGNAVANAFWLQNALS